MSILKYALLMLLVLAAVPSFAQGPPSFAPPQLEQLVSRIALYPDPLVAQILAGATYPDQIPDAARWADQHHYLTGQALANAIQGDQLPWDPSVQALLPFPSVLEMMASDMNWTTDLGNAFLAQEGDVMDAVQRERRKAREYGYLRSNGQILVGGGPYITIMPVNPGYVVVPYYDPRVVFYAPRPGFFVGGGPAFLWAARSASAMAPRSGFRFDHGAGAMTASIGAGMACSLITRDGAEPGTIVANMLIHTLVYTVSGQGIASRTIIS
jgi:hypothetical protein